MIYKEGGTSSTQLPVHRKKERVWFHEDEGVLLNKVHHQVRWWMTEWEKILQQIKPTRYQNVQQEMSTSNKTASTALIEKWLKAMHREQAAKADLRWNGCSKSLVVREMQINTMENHFTPISPAQIQKLTDAKSWQGVGLPGTLMPALLVGTRQGGTFWSTVWPSLPKWSQITAITKQFWSQV